MINIFMGNCMLENLFPLLYCIDEHPYWPQIEIGPPSPSPHLTKNRDAHCFSFQSQGVSYMSLSLNLTACCLFNG